MIADMREIPRRGVLGLFVWCMETVDGWGRSEAGKGQARGPLATQDPMAVANVRELRQSPNIL